MKVLMKGNEALAEAASAPAAITSSVIPITPQTELAAYMSKRMPQVNGTYSRRNLNRRHQHGAGRLLCRRARHDFFLLSRHQPEGRGYLLYGRFRPARGDHQRPARRPWPWAAFQPSQSDYLAGPKATGHGDFQILVFAPSTVQEMVDLISHAFDTADKYRMPAMVLADGMLGQMMEPVELPEGSAKLPEKEWAAQRPWWQARSQHHQLPLP